MGSVFLDHNEAKEEFFLVLDELQLSVNNLEKHLNWIEDSLSLPPYLGYGLGSSKELIIVEAPKFSKFE